MSIVDSLAQRFTIQVQLSIVTGMVSLALLLSILHTYLFTQWQDEQANQYNMRIAALVARQTQLDLRDNSPTSDYSYTRAILKAFPQIKHLSVVRYDNQVVASFGDDIELPPNLDKHPVRDAQLVGDVEELRLFQVPIPGGSASDSENREVPGYVYAAVENTAFWDRAQLLSHTAVITTLVTGVLLVILFLVIRRVTGPLGQLSSMLTTTHEGNTWPDRQPYGAEEVQQLWRQLNLVLKAQDQKLDSLDSRFAEKTREFELIDGKRQALISNLNTTLEQERRHLARVLHDEINVTLFAIRLRLQHSHQLVVKGCSPETCKKVESDLDDVIGMLTSVYNNNRYTSNQLRSEGIEKLGLVGAIDQALQYYNGIEGCRFSMHADNTLPSFKDNTGLGVFRVVEECIVNIVKHAQASKALITVNPLLPEDFEVLDTLDFVDLDIQKYESFKAMVDPNDNVYVHIVIQDNGVGIPRDIYSKQRDGIGLLNMQERLNSVSGCLLFSRESPGTRTDIFFV